MKLTMLSIFLLLMLITFKSIKERKHSSFKHTNFLIVIIWSGEPVLENLSFKFNFLNSQVVSGKLVLSDLIYYALIVCALLIWVFQSNLARNKDFEKDVSVRAALPFLIALYALSQSVFLRQGWLQPFVCTFIYFLIMILPKKIKLEKIILSVLYSFAFILVSQMIHLLSSNSVTACRLDKCSLFTSVYNGNGNGLGLRIMFISLFICTFITGRKKIALGTLVLPYLLFLGGRTSLYVYALCFVLLQLINNIAISRRILLMKSALFTAVVISLIPVFVTFKDESFTYRGQLWSSARRLWTQSLLIGHGPSYWVYMGGELGFVANNGTHNIWLDSLVGGGILAGMFFAFWAIKYGFAISSVQPEMLIVLVSLLLSGMVESVFSFWKIAFGFPVIVSVLLLKLDFSKQEFRIRTKIELNSITVKHEKS